MSAENPAPVPKGVKKPITTRAKKIAQYKKGTVWETEWLHADYLEYFLQDFTRDGSLLHVCCGYSEVGNTRVDISPESTRTMHGDVFHLLDQFKPNEFDYVYIDPPFKFYTSGDNRFKWQFDAFKIAKRALITRRPRVGINMPSIRHRYFVCEDSRPSLTLIRVDYK